MNITIGNEMATNPSSSHVGEIPARQ